MLESNNVKYCKICASDQNLNEFNIVVLSNHTYSKYNPFKCFSEDACEPSRLCTSCVESSIYLWRDYIIHYRNDAGSLTDISYFDEVLKSMIRSIGSSSLQKWFKTDIVKRIKICI